VCKPKSSEKTLDIVKDSVAIPQLYGDTVENSQRSANSLKSQIMDMAYSVGRSALNGTGLPG
jgi:hypothetical protein